MRQSVVGRFEMFVLNRIDRQCFTIFTRPDDSIGSRKRVTRQSNDYNKNNSNDIRIIIIIACRYTFL